MNKCKYEPCHNEVISTGNRVKEFCSNRCRMKHKRSKPNIESEHIQTEQPKANKGSTPLEFTSQEVTLPPILDQPDITKLPHGVSRPTGHRTNTTARSTAHALSRAVSGYHGLDWISSPEYAEVIYRLLTLSADELEEQGQSVPGWRVAA